MANSVALALLVASSAFKLLLFPAYRSTDFEVHRNWLAITHSLPVREWYVNDTSQWTLDYPPLFAWFEYVLSLVGKWVDPQMLIVTNLKYASDATVAFQRSSVVVTEGLLLFAVYLFCKRIKPALFPLLLFLIALNPGLLIVDHVHFQYNGLLLGLFMLSIEALQRDQILVSALLFSVLLNMKHLFAVAAPYYFVYMLRRYCVGTRAFSRFFVLGSVVAGVCVVSVGPFIYNGTAQNLLSRLFPFGRGLCHAYWAPNFWAIYSVADKALVKLARSAGLQLEVQGGHLAGGIVGVSKFGILPQISPSVTLVLVLLSMMPCLVKTWVRPQPCNILQDIAYVNLCGFMFGYHVHEKAVLHFMLPMAFGSILSKTCAPDYATASWPAYISLMPLLYQPQEQVLKQVVVLSYCTIISCLYSSQEDVEETEKGKAERLTGGGHHATRSLKRSLPYIAVMVGMQLYCNFFHGLLFGSRLGFLPLLLLSVSSALGLFALFCRRFLAYVADISNHHNVKNAYGFTKMS